MILCKLLVKFRLSFNLQFLLQFARLIGSSEYIAINIAVNNNLVMKNIFTNFLLVLFLSLATPSTGYTLVNRTKDGHISSSMNYTVTGIKENAEYVANFKQNQVASPVVTDCNIPSDNTMRYYRLAIAVDRDSYTTDFGSDYNNVKQFWQDCEDFMNEMYVPLGMCFDAVVNRDLIMSTTLPINSYNGIPEIGGVTTSIDNAIGSSAYDIGIWVVHRDDWDENTGLSNQGGAYNPTTKANGYAKADKWVVAHEIGHLFGADHTTTGEGSLMDNAGEFFSYPSIKKIRDASVSNGPGNAHIQRSVSNNAPTFTSQMKETYRIPQGAFLAIPVYASDADGHSLRYTAIGCSSSTVGNIVEGGTMPHFYSFKPQTSNIIEYSPQYTADIIYDTDFYLVEGTDMAAKSAGTYSIAILVNDMPAANSYDYLTNNPFYSNYAVWDANVEIVSGTSFAASLSPSQNSYTAGQTVTVNWGVNNNYFTEDSRVRITMSTDYGKTFNYVLADNVSALDGSKAVTLPNVNVGNVDVDFTTATRSMRGGIIRVEEVDGAAYTLTTTTPENGGGFTVTGGGSESETDTICIIADEGENGKVKTIYDLKGRKLTEITVPGFYIIDGKRLYVK